MHVITVNAKRNKNKRPHPKLEEGEGQERQASTEDHSRMVPGGCPPFQFSFFEQRVTDLGYKPKTAGDVRENTYAESRPAVKSHFLNYFTGLGLSFPLCR